MSTDRRILGMTPGQIAILVGLALVACILVCIFAWVVMNSMPTSSQPAPPAYTPVPTQTPAPTRRPWPTVTPIPDWKKHTLSEGEAEIWLPQSYQGGDTSTSSTEIMEMLRATVDDEAFISDIQGLIAIPEITFFAFDSNSNDTVRFMYVGREALNPDLYLSMDDYLNRLMDTLTGGTERVIERQIVQLDQTESGKLVVENKVPAGEYEAFIRLANYLIRVDDTLWFITFRTGREEFDGYQPTIEASVNSFWVQR